MAKAIHSMLRVLDERRSVDFYQRGFGLSVADRFEFNDFTLVYLRDQETDFELELTINQGQAAPYDLGSGYGHLAFAVDDLDAEHRRFTSLGFNPRSIVDLQHNDAPLARFFFVQDPDGYRIEVLEKRGRYR
jgi:lactoylglutathione lyase